MHTLRRLPDIYSRIFWFQPDYPVLEKKRGKRLRTRTQSALEVPGYLQPDIPDDTGLSA